MGKYKSRSLSKTVWTNLDLSRSKRHKREKKMQKLKEKSFERKKIGCVMALFFFIKVGLLPRFES